MTTNEACRECGITIVDTWIVDGRCSRCTPEVTLSLTAAELMLIKDCLRLSGVTETAESYGHFRGGDPRDFSPDPECSTDEERAQHAADCDRWNSGEPQEPEPGPHAPLIAKGGKHDGKQIGHVTMCGYGLGTNRLPPDPADVALMERLESLARGPK